MTDSPHAIRIPGTNWRVALDRDAGLGVELSLHNPDGPASYIGGTIARPAFTTDRVYHTTGTDGAFGGWRGDLFLTLGDATIWLSASYYPPPDRD